MTHHSFQDRRLRCVASPRLVLTYQAAVAFDIGMENRSELAFHTHLPGGDYPAGSFCLSNGGDFADAQPIPT